MLKINRLQRYLLSILSGILMVLSFPFTGSCAPLMLVALIPLLLVEDTIFTKKMRSSNLLVHAYTTFFIYNLGTTWWIWNASSEGAIFAFVLNSLIMALVFQVFHFVKKYTHQYIASASLVILWISFEWVHYTWELSWPWLNLGNVFATFPQLVQWYAFTGVLGGTMWILIINLLGLSLIKHYVFKQPIKALKRSNILFCVILIFPILVSIIQYTSYKEVGTPTQIVVTQPNIDPYNEKFVGSVKDQLNKICDLADSQTTENTDFVLAPETALPFSFYEDEIKRIIYYPYLVDRKAKWPSATLLIGASTKKYFKYKRSRASINIEGAPGYEENYNSSMMIDHLDRPSFIHKSKLVLGVEKIPFSNIFPWLETLAINNGGTSGTLGIENTPSVFQSKGITFAPVVCYESIYGDFIAQQCRKGAELIFIITNDGWWKDTPGYKQHMSFARLRAIENRKSIARSANTGTSCFINQRGDVLQATSWWVEAAIKEDLKRNKEKTFYTNYGDWLGRGMASVSSVLIIFTIYLRVRRKK